MHKKSKSKSHIHKSPWLWLEYFCTRYVANEYEYSGTMTVTAGGSDNVSEDVAVDCLLDKEASTMKILFHKVKFVPQMPISLDVTVP